MLQNDQLICDSCQKLITHITAAPSEGWERMHNLCSSCYAALKAKAVARPT